jgi:hypothetical protein
MPNPRRPRLRAIVCFLSLASGRHTGAIICPAVCSAARYRKLGGPRHPHAMHKVFRNPHQLFTWSKPGYIKTFDGAAPSYNAFLGRESCTQAERCSASIGMLQLMSARAVTMRLGRAVGGAQPSSLQELCAKPICVAGHLACMHRHAEAPTAVGCRKVHRCEKKWCL